jgi:hypothetical protein
VAFVANRGAEATLWWTTASFRNEEWIRMTRASRREGFFRSLLEHSEALRPERKAAKTRCRTIGESVRRAILLFALLLLVSPAIGNALIFASPEFEPVETVPEDFPYWEHVTQRRYDGPTVIYLGLGWALTARHVGMGEIILDGQIILPNFGSARTLMNVNGSPADIMVFQLALDAELPEMPILPLAKEAPRAGEEVLLIGFGRERAKVIEWNLGGRTHFGFEWTQSGRKRWGTNRIESGHEILVQEDWTTRAITFIFDLPRSLNATTYESHAASGDSGGAVFVHRDGVWMLVGMMTSVSARHPMPEKTSQYGDTTWAADVSHYREEIFRWTRSHCANEEDDDGDGKIDFPLDPDCESPADRDERDLRPLAIKNAGLIGLVSLGGLGLWFLIARGKAGHTGAREPD